jgi:undecaprenyl-diphosphatase
MTPTVVWPLVLLQERALQGEASAFRWAYVWLGLVGLVLVLSALAFVYLLVRRRGRALRRVLHHPAFGRADRLLAARVPRLWAFVRRRFSVQEWRGLALTAAAGIAFVAVYLFVLVTESWTDEAALYAVDRAVYEGLAGSVDGRAIPFMRAVTHFADALTVVLVSLALGGFLLLRRRRWEFLSLFLVVGVGAALMYGLKGAFGRSRPVEQLAETVGHSFPSGHAFHAVTLYGFLVYLTWRFVPRDAVRLGVTFALTLLVVLVGLSRVVLRVHWVSDVAGGFAVGLAWLVCALVAARALRARRERRAGAAGEAGGAP